MTVDRLVGGREVGVLEQLAAVSAESLDVLVVGLPQLPLEAPVHRPVPAQGALLVIQTPGGSPSWSSASWHASAPWRDRSSSGRKCKPISKKSGFTRPAHHKARATKTYATEAASRV